MAKQGSKRSLKERRRRARFITVALSAALALSVVIFIAVVARIPETKIVRITVSDTTYVHQGALEQVALQLLSGTHFFLIPRTHTFFAPLSSIRKEIERSFPAVERVVVRRDTMRALTIEVTEKDPSFLWCRSEECFYMSSDGYIFAPVQGGSNDFVRYEGAITDNPTGVFFLDGSFQDLNTAVENIATIINDEARRVSVDMYDDVTVTFKSGAELIFVRTAQREVLLDAITSVFSVKRVHETRVLEYADFRFGNKIFVKFEGDDNGI